MTILFFLSFIYLLGYAVSFIMQRTEILAEKQPYTFGDRLLIVTTSLLSWLWVVVILVTSWINYIKSTGFWSEEVVKTEVIDYKKQPVKN